MHKAFYKAANTFGVEGMRGRGEVWIGIEALYR